MDKEVSTNKLFTDSPPIFENKYEDKFETLLFLPQNNYRIGEGGLRKKGVYRTSFKSKPLITIVTATYNSEKYLEETIQSVLAQTYDNIEYLIIDGGSTDGTLDILKNYDDKINYWISEKDSGIYDAWNKAIQLSHGDWVAFLGSDDVLLPKAMSSYVEEVNKNNSIDFISSRIHLCDSEKNIIQTIGKPWKWSEFKKIMSIAHPGSLHNIKFIKQNGMFNTEFKLAADYEYLMQKKSGLKSSFLKDVTCYMRNFGISSNILKAHFEIYKVKLLHKSQNRLTATIFLILYILNFEIKDFFSRLKLKYK